MYQFLVYKSSKLQLSKSNSISNKEQMFINWINKHSNIIHILAPTVKIQYLHTLTRVQICNKFTTTHNYLLLREHFQQVLHQVNFNNHILLNHHIHQIKLSNHKMIMESQSDNQYHQFQLDTSNKQLIKSIQRIQMDKLQIDLKNILNLQLAKKLILNDEIYIILLINIFNNYKHNTN